MTAPLRIAVIGAGAMGQHHIRVYNELRDAHVVAVCEPDASRQVPAGVARYTDHEALLDSTSVDAVSIAVPARLHGQIAVSCIEHGIPALIEKPIAASLSEAEWIVQSAEQRHVPVMIGHIERFNPVIIELQRRIRMGELGRIQHVRIERIGPFHERIRDVGVVHDLATHDIDLLHWVLDDKVESVQARTLSGVRTEYEDLVSAIISLSSGVIASIEANWLSPAKSRMWTLLSDRGLCTVDLQRSTINFAPRGKGARIESIDIRGDEPLRAELETFIATARGLAPPAVTAFDGLAALRVAEAIVQSARSGRPELVHTESAS